MDIWAVSVYWSYEQYFYENSNAHLQLQKEGLLWERSCEVGGNMHSHLY